MDKMTFISEIKPILKQLGYRKNKNYWYKSIDSHLCCINVQGSQWCKDNYYVEIGITFSTEGITFPNILQWNYRHRCIGSAGDLNILPHELLSVIEAVFNNIDSTSQVPLFMSQHRTIKISSQYIFFL